jgi:hypothetical protein
VALALSGASCKGESTKSEADEDPPANAKGPAAKGSAPSNDADAPPELKDFGEGEVEAIRRFSEEKLRELGQGTRERGTTVSLRVYEHSALAWASVVAHHKEHARRFGKRELAAGPDLGADSFRKPMGETFDVTCAVLGDDIACLSASARHTEDWVRNDQKLLSIVRDRLKER